MTTVLAVLGAHPLLSVLGVLGVALFVWTGRVTGVPLPVSRCEAHACGALTSGGHAFCKCGWMSRHGSILRNLRAYLRHRISGECPGWLRWWKVWQ